MRSVEPPNKGHTEDNNISFFCPLYRGCSHSVVPNLLKLYREEY